MLARAVLPLAVLFILSACGGSAKPVQKASHAVAGDGYRFDAPAGWTARRTDAAVVVRHGDAQVSVTSYTLLKPYTPALFGRAAKELDGVAAKLASQASGTLTERATTEVDGRKIRAYRLSTSGYDQRIGFVLDGRHEYQLLCRAPKGADDPDGACALLFESFRVAG